MIGTPFDRAIQPPIDRVEVMEGVLECERVYEKVRERVCCKVGI